MAWGREERFQLEVNCFLFFAGDILWREGIFVLRRGEGGTVLLFVCSLNMAFFSQ